MCVPLSTYLNEPVTYQTIVASSINDRVAAANPYFPWQRLQEIGDEPPCTNVCHLEPSVDSSIDCDLKSSMTQLKTKTERNPRNKLNSTFVLKESWR